MSLILAFDPGVSTGVAVKMDDLYMTQVSNDPNDVCDMISHEVTCVVYEDFAAEVLDHNGLFTVKVIGGLLAMCHYHKVKCVRHQPQYRYPWLDAAKEMQKTTVKRSGQGVHELDALAHLLAYLETGK